MAVYELDAFLRLSAVLNYQLSTDVFGPGNIVGILLEEDHLPRKQQDLLISVLQYLIRAYGQKRRRLGPMAILHPIRATALLTRAGGKASFLDLLSVLLHDKLEDIHPEDFPPEEWLSLEEQFKGLLKQIDPSDEWFLMERLELLKRQEEGQTYCRYIGRMVNQPKQTPDLVRVKLADRLDNTLDMRVDIHDPLEGVDFFSHTFQLLFVGSYTGYRPPLGHPPRSPISGAQRLYELFKNTVLLSLIRQRPDTNLDAIAARLFHALSLASMKEAQRTIMHIFGYHILDIAQQREILEEAMSYCLQGGSDAITAPTSGRKLDGLFIGCFDHHDSRARKEKMDILYLDKPLMVQASIAFIVIFLSFLGDEKFYVRGITPHGIRPAEAG